MIRAALVLSLLAAPAWAEPARVVALGGTVAEIAAALGLPICWWRGTVPPVFPKR